MERDDGSVLDPRGPVRCLCDRLSRWCGLVLDVARRGGGVGLFQAIVVSTHGVCFLACAISFSDLECELVSMENDDESFLVCEFSLTLYDVSFLELVMVSFQVECGVSSEGRVPYCCGWAPGAVDEVESSASSTGYSQCCRAFLASG
ncbi:hypothetical protein Aduo_004380 [Ancylostoma duodenale]